MKKNSIPMDKDEHVSSNSKAQIIWLVASNNSKKTKSSTSIHISIPLLLAWLRPYLTVLYLFILYK